MTVEKTLVIAFEHGQAFLAPGYGLPLNRTNIPGTYQPLRPGIHWTVTVINQSSFNGNLITRIRNYHGSRERFLRQTVPDVLPPEIIINDMSTSELYAAWDRAKWKPMVTEGTQIQEMSRRPGQVVFFSPPCRQSQGATGLGSDQRPRRAVWATDSCAASDASLLYLQYHQA